MELKVIDIIVSVWRNGVTLSYEQKKDMELIQAWNDGNEYAFNVLLERYKPMMRSVARKYFLIGADNDDLIQEGMIGFYKSIMSFDENKNIDFLPFARMCVERQIITAVKNAGRKKHKPLNEYISTSGVSDDKSENSQSDLLLGAGASVQDAADPEEIMLQSEKISIVYKEIESRLSNFERKVLDLFISGMTYQEMAASLNKPEKSVDNAIQRIKKKLKGIDVT